MTPDDLPPKELLILGNQGDFEDLLRLREEPPPTWSPEDWMMVGSVAGAAAAHDDKMQANWRRVAIIGYERTVSVADSHIIMRAAFHRQRLILEEGAVAGDAFRDPAWFAAWLRRLTDGQTPAAFAQRANVTDGLVRCIQTAIDLSLVLRNNGWEPPTDVLTWLDAR